MCLKFVMLAGFVEFPSWNFNWVNWHWLS